MSPIRRTVAAAAMLAVLPFTCRISATEPIRSFTTGGHTVYHLHCANVGQGETRALVAAALDGTVLCFTQTGDLRWKTQFGDSLPLDLEVADLDGDDRDETLIASADGTLYVLDHSGELKWQFSRDPPLVQVSLSAVRSREP